MTGVPQEPGAGYRILAPISAANIEVNMIVLNAADGGRVNVSFTVHRSDFESALARVRDAMADHRGCEVVGNDRVVKISVIGVGMRSHAGIATRMFAALAREAASTCGRCPPRRSRSPYSCNEAHLERGVACLHEAFGLDQPPGQRPLLLQARPVL